MQRCFRQVGTIVRDNCISQKFKFDLPEEASKQLQCVGHVLNNPGPEMSLPKQCNINKQYEIDERIIFC